jgi:hypothetical protein
MKCGPREEWRRLIRSVVCRMKNYCVRTCMYIESRMKEHPTCNEVVQG